MLLDVFDKEIEIKTIPRIIFVEGFDCTGKSTFIESFCALNGFELWEPKYHTDYPNSVLPYNHRYALGIALIDLVEDGITIEDPIIVNRGIISGLVYNKLYSQGISNMNTEEFLDYSISKYSDPALIHTIYINHKSKENAQKLYESSRKRNNESYDDFESFESYMEEYSRFNSEYLRVLNEICKDNFTVFSVLD